MNETSPQNRPQLPEFIAVGPPRTATTWLHEVLKGQVCLPALVKRFSTRHYDRAANYIRRTRLIGYILEGGDPFPPLTAEVSARLREHYRPEMEKLEQLIGRDLSAWKFGPQPQSSIIKRPIPAR